MNNFVTRLHLKTSVADAENGRKKLVDFCLSNPDVQYLAIGWSCVHSEEEQIYSYNDFYDAVKKWNKKYDKKRIDSALNLFKYAQENDLFWTRDLDGFYWMCRVKDNAVALRNDELDIGAVLPVEAYKYGLEVPGQIKAAFNRPRGGIVQKLYEKNILEFSKYVFNKLSGKELYEISVGNDTDIIDNLPDFQLEELVISYIQLKYNYYLLSNSIANKSTTIKIECEFMSREKGNTDKAVVQVKAKKGWIDVSEYKNYLEKGYKVFFYSNNYANRIENKNIIYITRDELLNFYKEYKANLPESITIWENLFD